MEKKKILALAYSTPNVFLYEKYLQLRRYLEI